MNTYYATGNISFNGKDYAIGDKVRLSDSLAAKLSKVVTKETPAKEAEMDQGFQTQVVLAREISKIREVIKILLDRKDTSLWTSSGKPQVAAIEAVIGHDISAAARDLAWDAINA